MSVWVCFLVGCGAYHWGSVMHPQVKTLAVGTFTNDTKEGDLSVWLRQQIVEQVMGDGSLRVVSSSSADAIVQGRIIQCLSQGVTSTDRRPVSDDDSDSYQYSIFRAQVQVEFEVVIPGREEPLVARRVITGYADYSRLADLHIARRRALRQATVEAGIAVVAAITEAW